MTALLEPQAPPQDTAPIPADPTPAPAPVLAAPEAAPAPAPAPERPGRLRTLLAARPDLTPTGVRLIGAALLVLFWAEYAVMPAADGPDQDIPTWAAVFVNVQTFALFAAVAGFAMGRRWALRPALLFTGMEAVNIGLCPATGHHVIAGWWFAQVAIGAAMLLVPAVALLRTRPRR